MARRSSPSFRRGTLAVVLALVLSAVATVPAAQASSPTLPSSIAECVEAPSMASVGAGKWGEDANGEDPNDVTRERVEYVQELLAEKAQRGLAVLSKLSDRLRVTVPVHVHVITRDDRSGAPARDRIDAQLAVLNSAYAGETSDATARTIFRFKVKSIDYTANTDWYDWSLFGDTDDVEAKTALHRGGPGELNLYIAGLEDTLGYATFPFDKPGALDGVVIYNETLPGGLQDLYNLGDRLVHEVGHWLGLFHTFENGCHRPGDGVPDTPYQHDGDNIVSCNESEDTCPARGRDPVHNFMSYGDDLCMDRFSRGQSVRMLLSWFVFRAELGRHGALDLLGALR